MKKIKSSIISIALIIVSTTVIIGAAYLYLRYLPNRKNASLSHIQLKSNIDSIARRYTNVFADCDIYDVDDKLRFKNDDVALINNMDENQRIISIGGGDTHKENRTNREIYGIFECWLYLRDKKLPYEVIAICWDYAWAGIYTTTDVTTIITKPEFEEIYNNVDMTGHTREQSAKALGDEWIKQTGYVKTKQ